MSAETVETVIQEVQWIRVCHLSEIPARGGRVARVGETEVAIFRLSHGSILAIENRCPHRGGAMSEGIVTDNFVVCPLHGWRIDLVTGEAVSPDKGCVARYPVDIREGEVFLNTTALESPARHRPMRDVMGVHPDNQRPRLGRRRAQPPDFSIHELNREIPVLAVEPASPTNSQTHRLTITPLEGDATTYSIEDMIAQFETVEVPTFITCLMFGFTRPVTWRGVRLQQVLEHLGHTDFNFASFFSWDTTQTPENERFFETLKQEYVLDPRTLLVFGMNGRELPREHGGPLRLAVPFLQGYKSVKWLSDIRLCETDEVGYKKRHGFIEFPEFHPPADREPVS